MVVEALGNRFHCWTTLRKREKSVLLYSRWCKKGKRTCVGKTMAQRRGRQSMKARSEMMFSALDIEELVSSSLAGSSGPGGVIIGPAFSYAAGLVTSFSPCTLSMLPLTIGYIASDDNHEKKISETESNSSDGSVNVFLRCASFSLGLSTTLTVAGSLSAVMGKGLTIGNAFGSSGPLLASTVAIVMGLNVLGVVQLFMPSFLANFDTMNIGSGQVSNRPDDSTNNNSCNCSSEHVRIDDWTRDSNGNLLPGWFRAYLTGMVFALAASPCSTSVLATILAYVASASDGVNMNNGNMVGDAALRGGAALMAYSMGYVSPMMIAATATSTVTTKMLALREKSGWITTASGVVLVTGGVYGLCTIIL